jgi:hypothetical protein
MNFEISKTLSSFNVLDRSDLLDLSKNNTSRPTAFASNFTGGKKTKPKPTATKKPISTGTKKPKPKVK